MNVRYQKQGNAALKVAAFSDKARGGRLSEKMARFAVFLALMGGSLFFSPPGEGASLAKEESEVAYPISAFQDGKARFYGYKTPEGIHIKYFILRSSDGVIRAAFDACDVCWPEGKGYKQKGEYMVCVNCGKRFASGRVGEVQGGCNPAPLKREVVGDKLVVKLKDILEGKKYFNFAKKG
jgi:uncharacterized membrane protein